MSDAQAFNSRLETGLSWAPDVPSDWTVKRGKFLFNVNKRQVLDTDEIVTAFRNGRVTLRRNRRTDGFTNAAKEIGYQRVLEGDLVIHAMDAFAGAVGVSDATGKCTPVYACCTPKGDISAGFYARMIRTMALSGFIESLAKGIRERSTNFSWNEFSEQPLPVPPYEQQLLINSYLDRETARIDGLIEKKTRFIALLKEKRAAAITHAVTKGIKSAAGLKPSGIEWIGEVPSHWKVTKLGYLGRSANGINIGGDAFGSGYPFVSYGDVYKNRELPSSLKGLVQSSKADRVSYSVKAGDILFTRTSETVDEVAFPSVAMQTIDNAVFAGFLIRFRPFKNTLAPNFAKYAFQNIGLRDFFAKEMKIVTRASLSQRLLHSLPVPLPPLDEQILIGDFLEKENQRYETLVSNANRSIALLREKRAALITAAVTGKIDVRSAA